MEFIMTEIDNSPAVTFGMFHRLATRHLWTVETLAREFRGRIDDPTEFFGRVYRAADRREVIIPYKPVLDLYFSWLKGDRGASGKVCLCGCGASVIGREKYASMSCRKRQSRKMKFEGAQTPKSGSVMC